MGSVGMATSMIELAGVLVGGTGTAVMGLAGIILDGKEMAANRLLASW